MRFKWNSNFVFSIPQVAFCIVYRDSAREPSEGIDMYIWLYHICSTHVISIWYLMPQLLKVTIAFFVMSFTCKRPFLLLQMLHCSLGFHRRIVGFTWLWKNRVDLCKRWQSMSWFVSRSVGSWVYWDVTVGYQKRRFTPYWTVNSCWRASKFKLVQFRTF